MPPRFLSIEFHIRFFPVLLWNRIRRIERSGTGFSSIIELNIASAVSVFLIAVGTSYSLSHKSALGWVAGGLGAVGMLILLIHSISSVRKPTSYDRFLAGAFFLFVVFGLNGGIFAGTLYPSPMISLLMGSLGLLAGYLLGILAGLFLQYLGWLASMVSGLAGLAAFGLLFVDLVLMAGWLFE